VIAPAANPTSKLGKERTAKSTPTILLESVIDNTSHPNSTCCMPAPTWLHSVAPQSTGKPGVRSVKANRLARAPLLCVGSVFG
jgi:hypothetical protein